MWRIVNTKLQDFFIDNVAPGGIEMLIELTNSDEIDILKALIAEGEVDESIEEQLRDREQLNLWGMPT
jgi:hypothetical protein